MVDAVLLQIGGSAFLAILLFGIFGYEYQLPLVLNVILVPIIVGLGYLFALGLHYVLGFGMETAMTIEFVMLAGSILGFHLVTSG